MRSHSAFDKEKGSVLVFFFGFGAIAAYGPKTRKKRVSWTLKFYLLRIYSAKNSINVPNKIKCGLEDMYCWFSLSRHSTIDQNKNQNRSIDEVQNLGNERRYIYKNPRQDSGQRNISYTRYPKKCFTQIYRDLYGDAMLVPTWMGTNMADGNQQKHLLPSFGTKA